MDPNDTSSNPQADDHLPGSGEFDSHNAPSDGGALNTADDEDDTVTTPLTGEEREEDPLYGEGEDADDFAPGSQELSDDEDDEDGLASDADKSQL